MRHSSNKNTLVWQIFGAAVFVALWQTASVLIGSEVILPAPLAVVSIFVKNLAARGFWQTVGMTLLRWVCGLLPAFALGVVFGVLSERHPRFEAFFAPLFNILKSIPIVAVILITLVWFSAPLVPSVAVFLATFPAALENTGAGVAGIDRRLTEMARVYRFSNKKYFSKVWFPSVLPYLLAALKSCSGIGLRAVVVAELMVRPGQYAIGAEMQTARVTLETGELFSWTLVIVLIGYLADRLLLLLGRRLLRYREEGGAWKSKA